MAIRSLGVVLAAIALSAASADAQVELSSRATEITLTGRVHLQWNTTSLNDEISNEFLIRRARFTADVDFNDWISGKVQPDFGEGELSLKDAYVRLAFDPAFRATFGQFKRPFDVFELTSSTQILVVERAGGIRGVSSCGSVGNVCSYSRLTEKLEYADRDIGVMVDGVLGQNGQWRYMASVTNGTGGNAEDENDAKSYSGRLEFTPIEDLTIGGHVGIHDYIDDTGLEPTDEYAVAYGGDVEWGNFSEGLHVQAGFTTGDNWQDIDAGDDPQTFYTAQGILSYKIPMRESRILSAVEPVGRISYGDAGTDLDTDTGWLFTPGLVLFFAGRNKLGVNLDIWAPEEGDTEYSAKVQSYFHF